MNAIELKLQYLFLAFTAPVTLVYCLVLLILWNGEQGVIGFVYFISMFVVHIIINNRLAGLTVKRSALVEQRMKMLKESLDGIKLLKMYTWENTFRNIVCCLK
jgi:ABC-type multidrug transport system fused ATPase/permease subunit